MGAFDVTENTDKLEQIAKEIGDTHAKRVSGVRGKRFAEELHMEPVCRSVSEWVQRTEAEDLWGNVVQVLQKIDVGSAVVNQYFYETHCAEERAVCNGIDTRLYSSVCSDKHVWAYAKARIGTGEEGWVLIKVRSSCNCSLFKRSPEHAFIDIFSTSSR